MAAIGSSVPEVLAAVVPPSLVEVVALPSLVELLSALWIVDELLLRSALACMAVVFLMLKISEVKDLLMSRPVVLCALVRMIFLPPRLRDLPMIPWVWMELE